LNINGKRGPNLVFLIPLVFNLNHLPNRAPHFLLKSDHFCGGPPPTRYFRVTHGHYSVSILDTGAAANAQWEVNRLAIRQAVNTPACKIERGLDVFKLGTCKGHCQGMLALVDREDREIDSTKNISSRTGTIA